VEVSEGKIRGIFVNEWGNYRNKNTIRQVENINVLRMLACRTPLMGAHVYKCLKCGTIRKVPHSCKSRFCSVCGYVAIDRWIAKMFPILLNCWYHHVVVTVPSFFRWIVKRDRELVLNFFAKTAAKVIQDWARKRGYEVGIICFHHSFGGKLQFHPHFHLLVSAGGVKPDGTWYYTDEAIPGNILMPRFKAKFCFGIKDFFLKEKITTKAALPRVFKQIDNQKDEHWQFYTERITKRGPATVKYCVRYAKKMIMSEKRIISANEAQVTFFGKVKKKQQVLVYETHQFIKCLVQHIPEKHFRLIRYYGFYANASREKLANAKKYWKPLAPEKEQKSWQDRQMERDGKDPLFCQDCKQMMVLDFIIYPEPYWKMTFDTIQLIHGIPVQTKMKLDSS
jgi:hypothetical protein